MNVWWYFRRDSMPDNLLWWLSKRRWHESMVNVRVFGWDKADFSSKWCHLGTRIKRITEWKGLRPFCDNKFHIKHDCWNTTFRVNAHSHTEINTHRRPHEWSAQLQHMSHRKRPVSFQRTDGCQECTLPQNQWCNFN